MAKKTALVILVMTVIAGGIYSQEDAVGDETEMETETIEAEMVKETETVKAVPDAPKEIKNSLALDVYPLFKGFNAAGEIIEFDTVQDQWGNDIGVAILTTKSTFFCLGLGYERLTSPHLSFGIDLDMYFGKFETTLEVNDPSDPSSSTSVKDSVDAFYFGLAMQWRYYPMSESFDTFFIGAGLGFNVFSYDGKTKPEDGGFAGLTITLQAGYKILFPGKKIYLEPSVAYVLSKTQPGLSDDDDGFPMPHKWQGGLRFGFVY